MLNHINTRANKIRVTGYIDALEGRPAKPEFFGDTLGSMESFIYYEGYSDADPEFKNPYIAKNWEKKNEQI